MFSVFTARPAAISTFSASTVSVLPPASTVERHLVLADRRLGDLGAGDDVDAALPEALGQRVGASASSIGRMRGSASISVTLVPKALKMSANSHADGAGADDGQRRRRLLEEQRLVGADHRRLVDLEPDLRNALHPGAGGDDDGLLRLVHVARRPSPSCRAAARRVPLMTVTLCFFIRNSTPLRVLLRRPCGERFIATP